jgi:hypothetical protein
VKSGGWKTAALAVALAALVLGVKLEHGSTGLWPWTFHTLVLLGASEFVASGRRHEAAPPASLVRLALARALAGAVLGALVTSAAAAAIWSPPPNIVPGPLTGALYGLGLGIASVAESLARRRAPSAARDLAWATGVGLLAFAWTCYAFVEGEHLKAIADGDASLGAALDVAKGLIGGRQPEVLLVGMGGIACPLALAVLGRLRGLCLAQQVGLCVAGTCAISGLIFSWESSKGARFGLLLASLFSLLLPLLYALVDRFGPRPAAEESAPS